MIENPPQVKVFFFKFDATHRFWHIKLDEHKSKLLTFNTLFNRYRYLRLSFGISYAPKYFLNEYKKYFGCKGGSV